MNDIKYVSKCIKVYSVDLSPMFMRVTIPKRRYATESDITLKNKLSAIFKERFVYTYVAGIRPDDFNTHLIFNKDGSETDKYDVFTDLSDRTDSGVKNWAKDIFCESDFEIFHW